MVSYGTKRVRDSYVTRPDLLAFIIYQLTLGTILGINNEVLDK